MADAVDVAIVGAGPYGLSVGAHLREAGVSMRQFGKVMHSWRTAMPRGMYLTSPGSASSLSAPNGTHALSAFCRGTGRVYAGTGLPVPLATFIAYGQWFQEELAPGVEEVLVSRITAQDGCFELSLDTGERARARRVVIATGLRHFAVLPTELAGLPTSVCTHASAHAGLGAFRGRRVVVLGGGQSALETGALLHEQGTDVQVVAREPRVTWQPEPGLAASIWWRYPGLFRHLPEAARVRARPGPAGANWLRPRVEGKVPVLTSHALRGARLVPGGVTVSLAGPGGRQWELSADHVIAATGYRPDLERLPFLDSQLRAGLRTVAGSPAVGRDYQSSVPGLFFVGPVVTPVFGPALGLVSGADHAARSLAPRLTATAWLRTQTLAGGASHASGW
jgi:cation diffusion facilitator CzcD-associated flavoprotein CzcO